jgi:hypothetical protein
MAVNGYLLQTFLNGVQQILTQNYKAGRNRVAEITKMDRPEMDMVMVMARDEQELRKWTGRSRGIIKTDGGSVSSGQK